MTKFTVLVPVSTATSDLESRYFHELESLRPIGVKIVECDPTESGFIAAAKGVSAVYVKGTKINRRMIEALDECRVIALGSAGVDYVDLDAATEWGIPITNCPDTFTEEVADHAMMLLLAAHRRTLEQDRFVREGLWDAGRPQLLKIPRLLGQTLGFIAFGRVARAVAKRARPFGLRLMAYDPFIDEAAIVAAGVEPSSLEQILRSSDFVSLHLPATAETSNFIRAQHFQQMKRTAILINTGRGSTVLESDLIDALATGIIASAGLDVFAEEPLPQSSPLAKLSNVVLSSHVASASSRFDPARKRRVGQEIALVLTGRCPLFCANPGVLARSALVPWR